MNPNSKWFPESWSGRHSDRSISSKLNLWSRPSAMGGLVVFSVTADLFLFIVRAFSLFLNICYFGPITVFITCLFLMLCADGVLLLPNGVLSAEGVLSLPNGMLNPKISLQSSVSSATPVVIIHMITILISHHYLRRRLCWTPTTATTATIPPAQMTSSPTNVWTWSDQIYFSQSNFGVKTIDQMMMADLSQKQNLPSVHIFICIYIRSYIKLVFVYLYLYMYLYFLCICICNSFAWVFLRPLGLQHWAFESGVER